MAVVVVPVALFRVVISVVVIVVAVSVVADTPAPVYGVCGGGGILLMFTH